MHECYRQYFVEVLRRFGRKALVLVKTDDDHPTVLEAAKAKVPDALKVIHATQWNYGRLVGQIRVS
jgi:hypothetical protein